MLIRDAELHGLGRGDLRIEAQRVTAIGDLVQLDGESVLEARGGLLLPGLHDHHIHVAATVAAQSSVDCGPPAVTDLDGLARSLRQPGVGWLRGTGYHESVAGLLDAATLDRIAPQRPLRIQHRSGRMWFLNSAALDQLLDAHAPPPGLETVDGRPTGRLFDEDAWLRAALGGQPPAFDAVGKALASRGVTGLTDLGPANDAWIAGFFGEEHRRAALPQRIVLGGRLELAQARLPPGVTLGPAKLHLHEAELPALDEAEAFVRAAHAQGRIVAIHCVSEVELVYALAVLDAAGVRRGDRIEHAGIAPDSAVDEIRRLGLAVVSQPHFIAERGDAYRRDVEPDDQPLLYRLRRFLESGVTLAAGSDAPYGGHDPWASMAAAVTRRTAAGEPLGSDESLTPEQALALYLADPTDLTRQRQLQTGMAADLCLLDRPWSAAREDLSAVSLRATWIDGVIVHDVVDQAPG